ncbi:hypothetical protein ELI_01850 [Erythrobacter litoralis HTCC2594]|uniref:Uncharacterized protein n=1 Tax=Erythrobacter litoralis (strain HTCC2594) TaxID=314225 RepID=Q2NCX9_ERYLH|nr:hypothetical protein ELI_01850 [Erythrobacter litoralis HTCC2594]
MPPRPAPPLGASSMMSVPQIGIDGQRQTVNAGLSSAQTTWNVRSALNVAALNCLEPRFSVILPNYVQFLDNFERPLRSANNTVTAEFRDRYGARDFRAEQDTYMTQVYNYFALPPALDNFCAAALEVSNESLAVAPADLDSFSARALPRLEGVFEDFYRSYEQYQADLASWTATYGINAVPGQPVGTFARTGSLAPTPTEQIIYRETPDGVPRNDGLSGTRDSANVTVLPSVDPGASDAAQGPTLQSDPVLVTDPTLQTLPQPTPTPAPSQDSDVVFTSEPVVQDDPPEE